MRVCVCVIFEENVCSAVFCSVLILVISSQFFLCSTCKDGIDRRKKKHNDQQKQRKDQQGDEQISSEKVQIDLLGICSISTKQKNNKTFRLSRRKEKAKKKTLQQKLNKDFLRL